MSDLEGYMSDLELEEKMKTFFNYQPGKAFMKYMFSTQRLIKFYDKYVIAVEDEDEENKEKYKQFIIDIINDFCKNN